MIKKSYLYVVFAVFIGFVFYALILLNPGFISQLKGQALFEQDFKQLVIGRESDAISLDPAITTDSESFQITTNIFETLVTYENNGIDLKPGLAESWTTSEDGLKWVFKIRKNVTFHDGTKLDAKVVAFNFSRWMNTDSPYHTGKFSYWGHSFNGFPGIVKSVTALSDYTLEIVLNEPYAPFLNTLSMPAFGIASSDAIMKYNENLKLHPVGTGPFKLKTWEPGIEIILERNDDYWQEKAKVNEVVFRIFDEDEDPIELLRDGTVHIVSRLTPEEVDVLNSDDSFEVQYRPFFNIGYLALNNQVEPFDDVKVRQAIALLIDKDKMMSDVLNNLSRPAHSFLPPLMLGYHEGIVSDDYDLAQAKALLREAGYSEGFETTLWVMEQQRNYLPNPLMTAEYIKNQLGKANITVDIKTYKWDVYIEKIKDGDHAMALAGWHGDIIDPDNFLYSMFSSENAKDGAIFNYAFYRNDEVDYLLNQARRVSDTEFRIKLYRDLQEVIDKDVASIPLMHTMTAIGSSYKVINYTPYVTEYESLSLVDLLDEE